MSATEYWKARLSALQAEMGRDYPGKGDAWADFLHHRARVLDEWADEGKSPEESARIMSMDPVQVRLILARDPVKNPPPPRSLGSER